AHWEVMQVRAVLPQPDLGGSPAPAVPDIRQPVISVVMVRDMGSIRFPPFVIAMSSLIIFGIVTNVLHRRDKEIWAAKQANGDGGDGPAPAPEPDELEPAGV